MKLEEQRLVLTRLGVDLQAESFIYTNARGKKHLIVSRTGIDKIERTLNIDFKFVSVTESQYLSVVKNSLGLDVNTKHGTNVTVVMEGNNGKCYYQALGSANPDTSDFKFYSDTAARRAKHKVVLKIAGLYKHGVHSEDESEDFRRPKKKDFTAAIEEATRKIPK
jgi:hypothetical protein